MSRRKNVVDNVIAGARSYSKLINKRFLILTEDNCFTEIEFHINDFKHLTGLSSNLEDRAFFKHALKGTLTKENINEFQKHNLNTLKHKCAKIQQIDKLIYANGNENLVLTNLVTDTYIYNIALKNQKNNICIGFVGKDNHARSLRKKNTHSEQELSIIAIFEKNINETLSHEYSKIVYLRNIVGVKENILDYKVYLSDELQQKLALV